MLLLPFRICFVLPFACVKNCLLLYFCLLFGAFSVLSYYCYFSFKMLVTDVYKCHYPLTDPHCV